MTKLNDTNYITIQGWMRTKLQLKGNDLLVYAIIYSFSQTEDQKFTGSLQYLADWCGATKQGISKNLKNLLDKGLIERKDLYIDKVNYVSYYATKLNTLCNLVSGGMKLSFTGMKHSFTGGMKLSFPNNKDSDNKDNNNKNNKRDIRVEDKVVQYYHSICKSLPKIRSVTDKRKKAIQNILKKYTLQDIQEAFEITESSAFLTGENDRGWKADLDFILREDKFICILEGKYSKRTKRNNAVRNIEKLQGRSEYLTEEEKADVRRQRENGEAIRI